MRYLIACAIGLWGSALQASEVLQWTDVPVDVVVLGEVHDNPAHHARQAGIITELAPTAVVYEMLTPEEGERLNAQPRDAQSIAAIINDFHWSNITDYAGVFAASSGVIVGAALPREDVRRAFGEGAASVFGPGADTFGLTAPVPADELALRKDLQFAAHCEAMPIEMMSGMVEAQRLRDAAFARTALAALEEHGPPVALITGNGHARRDWGVPTYILAASPDTTVISVGQSEAGARPAGGFDAVFDAPAVDRPDPCAAFR